MSHQPCAHYASGTNMISSTVEMIQEGWVKSQEERASSELLPASEV